MTLCQLKESFYNLSFTFNGDTSSTFIGSLRISDSLYNAIDANTCGIKKATMSICVFIVL
tara:strand:- start:286 stop:465 length:180 start_codon:yes stop_codon:yes gene_type:complete